MADSKDKKIPEVPHLEELTGVEKIPVSAVGGLPRYVEVNQIVDKAEEETLARANGIYAKQNLIKNGEEFSASGSSISDPELTLCTLENVKEGDKFTLYCEEVVSMNIDYILIVGGGNNLTSLNASGEQKVTFTIGSVEETLVVMAIGMRKDQTKPASFTLKHVTLVKGSEALEWNDVVVTKGEIESIDLQFIDNLYFTPPPEVNNDLWLLGYEGNRMDCIKAIRIKSGLSLLEAKEIVEMTEVSPALIKHFESYKEAIEARDAMLKEAENYEGLILNLEIR